jgi:hypothetical protein
MDKDFKLLLGALSVMIALCVLLFLAFAGADITGCTVQKGVHF